MNVAQYLLELSLLSHISTKWQFRRWTLWSMYIASLKLSQKCKKNHYASSISTAATYNLHMFHADGTIEK